MSGDPLKRIDPSIARLDLDPIIFQLIRKEGWGLDRAERAVQDYRIFLHLVKKSDQMMVPKNDDVDICWHHHILDTVKYTADSHSIFGKYLHHFPYSGSLGDEDASYQIKRHELSKIIIDQFEIEEN